MPNHVHLIIQTLNHPPSGIIHYIHSIYARYFNRKYHYVGHVFQDRYYAKLIKNSKQLIDTSSYVHLNPVKSKYANKPEDYHWSSYKSYITADHNNSIVDTQKILSNLGEYPYEKYKFYVETKFRIKDWNQPLSKSWFQIVPGTSVYKLYQVQRYLIVPGTNLTYNIPRLNDPNLHKSAPNPSQNLQILSV